MKFNFENNREEIEEYANIVISLEAYIKECANMDEKFISRYEKTLEKYKAKLAKCHKDQEAYFSRVGV